MLMVPVMSFQTSLLFGLFVTIISSSIGNAPAMVDAAPRITFNCNGGSRRHYGSNAATACLERSDYTIRAVLHGVKGNPFWLQIQAAMQQAAKDMRVTLEVKGLMSRSFDEEQMVSDILDTLQNNAEHHVSALIVSIPSIRVQNVVQMAIDSGMPVFGINSGYDLDIPGLLGHIAMDDKMGGNQAGQVFLDAWRDEYDAASATAATATTATKSRRVLFINHEKGNNALKLRLQGLQETLYENNMNHTVLEVSLDPIRSDAQTFVDSALFACLYDAVLLPGSELVEEVIQAYYTNGCSFEKMLIGTFDTRSDVYDAIAVSKLAFTISQQQYLQGALSVVMATVFATTGKSLLPESFEAPLGNYQTGPKVIMRDTLPTDAQQLCESEAFPVCNDDGEIFTTKLGSRCQCKDRRQIRIGSVLTGSNTGFWNHVWEGARQGAEDMGVQLVSEAIDQPEGTEIEGVQLAAKVKMLCLDGVDGLFTTINSQEIVEAIQFCQGLSVPVISVNSGAEFAQQLGLPQHISMRDYDAGYTVGQAMIKAGLKFGICIQLNLESDQCYGFRDAINDVAANDAIYGGTVVLASNDDALLFKTGVEANVTLEDDEWDGVGILLCSESLLPSALSLQQNHEKMLLGVFGSGQLVHESIEKRLLMFGIDEQPFLQGYLPVPLLTWHAHVRQVLSSSFLETGPKMLVEELSEDEALCDSTNFAVCPQPFDKNQLEVVRPIGLAVATAVFAIATGFVGWLVWNRKSHIVKASQPIFLVSICIGVILMAATIIPLSLDDGVLAEGGGCVGCECQSCNVACMSAPWLFVAGFSIAVTSLLSKILRLNQVVRSPTCLRNVKVSLQDTIIPVVVILGLNTLFMLMWTLFDPMYWDRSKRCGSDDFTSYGSCIIGKGRTSIAMASCVFAINFLAVIFATLQAYKGRHGSTEFDEGRYVALAIASILQIIMVGTPIMFLLTANPRAQFLVQTVVISLVCLCVLLLIFAPKIVLLARQNADDCEQQQQMATNTSLPTSSSSRSVTLRSGLRLRRAGGEKRGRSVRFEEQAGSSLQELSTDTAGIIANLSDPAPPPPPIVAEEPALLES